MCYFIHIVLPPGADLEAVRTLAYNHRLRFNPVPNTLEGPAARPGHRLLTTCAHCDCGTPIGSQRPDTTANSGRSSHDRAVCELRKKGWSDAKIRRWLAEQEKIAKRNNRVAKQAVERVTPLAEDWTTFIGDLLAARATPSAGLLKVWSPRQRIKIKDWQDHKAGPATTAVLLAAEDDIVYNFRP